MRGEYNRSRSMISCFSELPPHARRILIVDINGVPHYGTTSACAENTQRGPADLHAVRNYLRMRGEYSFGSIQLMPIPELPPHARRILVQFFWKRLLLGTTSACAENTCRRIRGGLLPRNYLRMRGEYWCREDHHD